MLLAPTAPTSTVELSQLACMQMSGDTAFVVDQSDASCCRVTALEAAAGTASMDVSCGGTYLVASFPKRALPSPLTAISPPPEVQQEQAPPATTNTTANDTATGQQGTTALSPASPDPTAASPEPSASAAEAEPFTAPAATQPYDFSMRFVGMDYSALMADPSKQAAFKADVRAQVAVGISTVTHSAITAANVQVGDLTEGSVVAAVTLHAPSAWSATEVATAADLVTTKPETIFSAAFKTAYQVTGVTTTLSTATPLPPTTPGPASAALTPGQQAGIALAVIIPVVAGAAGLFVVWRRRRAQAEAAALQFDAPFVSVNME